MTEIIYRIGDVTTADLPVTADGPNVVIAHVVNDVGRWGAGFTAALDRRWCGARTGYMDWARGSATGWPWLNQSSAPTLQLGNIRQQFTTPEPVGHRVTPMRLHDGLFLADVTLIHMCAQHGVRAPGNQTPIVYDALATCLDKVAACVVACSRAAGRAYEIRMPRIGCGLAGGTWDRVEPLVRAAADKHGVQFVVYDLFGAN